MQNPLVLRIVQVLDEYLRDNVALDHLHSSISSLGVALESDVPESVRLGVRRADNDLELLRHAVSEPNQRASALRVVLELKDVIDHAGLLP